MSNIITGLPETEGLFFAAAPSPEGEFWQRLKSSEFKRVQSFIIS
jgi:hypothetical protein